MKRLLIVDDEPSVAQTVGVIASTRGFQTEIVSTLDAMLHRLDTWHPTHLIVDLMMPDTDGVEVIRELARRESRVAVIILSGLGRRVVHAARRTAEQRGLNVLGALTKPFLPDALREMLARELPDAAWVGTDAVPVHRIDEDMLTSALQCNEFRMVYQPCVTMDRRIVSFEALMRWRHPQWGELLPGSFMPEALKHPIYHDMSVQAFDQSVRWLRGVGRGVGLSVNLSTTDLLNIGLVDHFRWMCAEHEVDPGSVTLEFTETSELFESADALDVLTRLQIAGFRLAIDDFGTGHSSMIQLSRLPIAEIKMDRSFVSSALTSRTSLGIVKTIIRLARDLGLTSAAEGVEDADTWALLEQLGCDRVQGWYVGRPMEGDAARELAGSLAA